MSYKEGQLVVLTEESKNYTSNYAGTDVRIIKIDNEVFCTVEAYDGRKFSCPYEYIMSYDEFYNKKRASCECGARYTSRPTFHLDYCPINGVHR